MQYVGYTDVQTRVVQGTAVSYFSTKQKDANLYFKARVTTRDTQGSPVIHLESPDYQVLVRGDRLFLNSYSIEGPNAVDSYVGADDITVSTKEKLYLTDTNKKRVEDVSSAVWKTNDAPEKVILALTNYSKNGNVLGLAYPLSLTVKSDGKTVYEDKNITEQALSNYYTLPAFTTS